MARRAGDVSDPIARRGDAGDRTTVATHFAAPLRRVLESRGLDPRAVLDSIGFSVTDPPPRVPYATAIRAWTAAAAATGDAALGLRAARVVVAGDYGVLEYVTRASPTLRAGLERLGRYHRLVNDGATVSLSVRGPAARLRYDVPRSPPIPRPYVDFVLATWVRMVREMTDEPHPFDRVRLPYPAPADVEPLRDALAPLLEFDAPYAELFSTRVRLDRPLPRADPQLSATLDQYAERLLARPHATATWRARVAGALRPLFADGTPRLAAIATILNVPERALRRHLQHEATSFAAVVDEVRRAAALELVRDPKLALGEIAFLLGFSEASAFHRAYRRWTGRTPRPRRMT